MSSPRDRRTSRRDDRLPAVRMLPPLQEARARPLAEDDLTAAQRTVLAHVSAGEDVVVHGPPGSGRTRLALTAAVRAADSTASPAGGTAGKVLLLAPRRAATAPLRDAVAHLGKGEQIQVGTPAGFGFTVIRAQSITEGTGEPTLVTGADQDQLVRDLVAARQAWHLPVEAATRTLPGFRAELRDVLSRAIELGIGPDRLAALAEERSRPAWADAADILRDYLDVLDLEASGALDAGPRLDSGALVRRAAALISAGNGPRIGTVVVDDAQDLTAAGIELVVALGQSGAQLVLLSCPDAAVDSFRGGVADAAARITARTRRPATTCLLPASLRSPRPVAAAIADLRARLPLAGAPTAARRPVTAHDPDPACSVLRASDPREEARLIAGVLRDLHHSEGRDLGSMAIVCRSGALVDDLADLLQREGLPTTTAQRPRALRDQQVVTDLLRIIDLGLTGSVPDGLEAAALLRGPYGDIDTLRLRRIRRRLLDAERREPAGDDEADSVTLLARALVLDEDEDGAPQGLQDLRGRNQVGEPLARIRAMIAAVRALGPRPAPVDALWAAWDAAHLATGWRAASLAPDDADGGARGRLAATRLDVISALFAAADRFTARRPHSDALVFADHVREQDVAEDTLAPRAQLSGRVRIATPAELAGEEYDVVVLARLQEGSWPNTRLRSTLFGATELALTAEVPDLPQDPAALRAIQRERVLADEVRLAVSALARARHRVLVTCVQNDDHAPSALVDVIERTGGEDWVRAERITADPGPAPEARRLVSALRRR
ncbi:MAG: DNA helicase, partial [Brachybacterium sp.]|nr:DNA helicase [Brachybacterium sp.]